MKWFVCGLLAAALVITTPALRADRGAVEQAAVRQPSAVEAQMFRQVIQAQLDAFAADDGHAAFSFASPSVRRVFGNPENFMNMVRSGYRVVYRPTSVSFLKPRALNAAILQPVQMADEDGKLWLAVYKMRKERDGTWRIDGCDIVRSEGSMT